MMSRSAIRVWANETRAQAGAADVCRCGARLTWFSTVARGRRVAINGLDPTPLQSERDRATGRTMLLFDRALMHVFVCPKRKGRSDV